MKRKKTIKHTEIFGYVNQDKIQIEVMELQLQVHSMR